MQKKAFTLVEMLVVIAIICILAALVIPIVNAAHEHSNRVNCKNNLHQMGLAFIMYASDNDDFLPDYICSMDPNWGTPTYRNFPPADTPNWVPLLYPKYINILKTFICPSSEAVPGDGYGGFNSDGTVPLSSAHDGYTPWWGIPSASASYNTISITYCYWGSNPDYAIQKYRVNNLPIPAGYDTIMQPIRKIDENPRFRIANDRLCTWNNSAAGSTTSPPGIWPPTNMWTQWCSLWPYLTYWNPYSHYGRRNVYMSWTIEVVHTLFLDSHAESISAQEIEYINRCPTDGKFYDANNDGGLYWLY